MLFKFLRRKRCPECYTLNTATGIFIRHEQCNLDVDHAGNHVSETGQVWLNHLPRLRAIEKASR